MRVSTGLDVLCGFLFIQIRGLGALYGFLLSQE